MAAFDGQPFDKDQWVLVDGKQARIKVVGVEPTTMEPNGYYIVNGTTVHHSDIAPMHIEQECGSGWTGDRCTSPLHHEGLHSNEEVHYCKECGDVLPDHRADCTLEADND